MRLFRQDVMILPVPTSLDGLIISIADSAGVNHICGQFFVSPAQGNFLVPSETVPGPATLTLSRDGGAVSSVAVTVAQTMPALFTMNATGEGVGSILTLRDATGGSRTTGEAFVYDTGAQQFVTNPIDLGDGSDSVYLMLFGTGIRGCADLSKFTATVGEEPVPVIGAAAQGQHDGLDQVNLGPLPQSLAGQGEMDIILAVDQQTANTVAVNIL